MAEENRDLNPHELREGEFCRIHQYERHSSSVETRQVYDIIVVEEQKNPRTQRRRFMEAMSMTYERLEVGLICEFDVEARLTY